ncbi:MAG: FAD-dependent oxidoreductase [Pseudomonadales bacterium]
MRDVDVAVIGAGPAGSALALRLAEQGLSVTLIERSNFDHPRAGETLAPTVKAQLADLGVWSAVQSIRPVDSYGVRCSWESPTPRTQAHLSNGSGSGWHVDRLEFDAFLAREAVHRGAVLRSACRVMQVDRQRQRWHLTLAQTGARPKQLQARVLVDASGREARLARALGAGRTLFDRLVGVVLVHRLGRPGSQHLVVEACEDGWWSSAPTAGTELVTTFMTDSDLLREEAEDAIDFMKKMQQAPLTLNRLVGARLRWGPRPVSALSQRLRRTDGRPWLAVGDAAFAVDPLSGTGVAGALDSARAAVPVVLAMCDNDGAEALRCYEADLDQDCSRYLRERSQRYNGVGRWPDAPFWKRRLGGSDALAMSG